MNNLHHCVACGTEEGLVYWVIDVNNRGAAFCRDCRTGRTTGIPDVWYGYGSGVHTEENIADPKTGEPIPFWDKSSKKAAMKKAGIQEAGDRIHGARNEDLLPKNRRTYFA